MLAMRANAIVCIVVASFAATPVHAAPITVLNHSFESLNLPSDNDLANPPTPPSWIGDGSSSHGYWNPAGPQTASKPYGYYFDATGDGTPLGAEGKQVAYAFDGGFLYQTLGTLAAGNYTITTAVGNRIGATSGQWRFDFRANGIAEVLASSTGATESLTEGRFTDQVINFAVAEDNAFIGTPMSVVLFSADSAEYDNVRVDFVAAVPEPTTIGLLGLAGGTFVITRLSNGRRRDRR